MPEDEDPPTVSDDDAERQTAVERCYGDERLSMQKTAERLGMSYHEVNRRVHASDVVDVRSAAGKVGQPAPEGLVETYLSGKSIADTKEAHGISSISKTRQMLLQAGVKLRPPGGRTGQRKTTS